MYTIFILIALMLILGFKFREYLVDYIWSCILILVVSFLAIMIVSDAWVDIKPIGEFPIIQVDNKYFQRTQDRYGVTKYSFAYQENNVIALNTTSAFVIGDEPKVVFSKQFSKLGPWGFSWPNDSDISWVVHCPKSLITNLTFTDTPPILEDK